MAIQDIDSAQVAHTLLDLKDGGQDGEFDKALDEKYGITFDNFHKLVSDLAPLCHEFWTKEKGFIRGFAGTNGWLAKISDKEI